MEQTRSDVRKVVKKRIMFNKEDDYYFITYNVLFYLYISGFTIEEKRLYDHRKLAYVLPFISNKNLLDMLIGDKAISSNGDVFKLQNVYYNARINMKTFTAILMALENKGFVHMRKSLTRSCIDIWIDSKSIPKDFIKNKLFVSEIDNITTFNKLVPRIKILTLQTLLQKIFGPQGGLFIWED